MDSMLIKPPCGEGCFSHINTIQSLVDACKYDDGVKNEGSNAKITNDQWSGQDITLYHLLQPIYGSNHCIIADILQTKTCKQVCI